MNPIDKNIIDKNASSPLPKRCEWCRDDPLYQQYHDTEWGVPNKDDDALFEFLLLEGQQAGLSWITILRKREGYRQAYDQFNAEKIARYTDKTIERLMANPAIVRNRLKIQSAVRNARAYLEIKDQYDSFSQFIWQFVDDQPIQNRWRSLSEIPAHTPLSDNMSKTLKKHGFNFVGSTICYAFMQATGMVNDHIIDCHRYDACQALAVN